MLKTVCLILLLLVAVFMVIEMDGTELWSCGWFASCAMTGAAVAAVRWLELPVDMQIIPPE